MVSVETVANWYGLNLPIDGMTDATPYLNMVSEINKRAKESDMSVKFKIGDIVSPNVDYYWAKDWMESEIVGRVGAEWKIKNRTGHVGNIVSNSMWNVVTKEKTMPEIGSKWENDGYIVTVVHISTGDSASVFYVFDDGSGTSAYIKPFLNDWKPYKEPETITRWTYVYRYGGEFYMDGFVYSTEKDAADDCSEYSDYELIKTIKVEYTPE